MGASRQKRTSKRLLAEVVPDLDALVANPQGFLSEREIRIVENPSVHQVLPLCLVLMSVPWLLFWLLPNSISLIVVLLSTLALVGFGASWDWQQRRSQKRPGSLVIKERGVELLDARGTTFLPWEIFDTDHEPVATQGVFLHLQKGTEHRIIRRRSDGVVVDDGPLARRHWVWLVGRRFLIRDAYGIDAMEIGRLIFSLAPAMADGRGSGSDRESVTHDSADELVIEGLPALHRATFRLGDGETRSVLTHGRIQLDPQFYEASLRRWPQLIRALSRWNIAQWTFSATAGAVLGVALLTVAAPWLKARGVPLLFADHFSALPVEWLLRFVGLLVIALSVASFRVNRLTRQLVEKLEQLD